MGFRFSSKSGESGGVRSKRDRDREVTVNEIFDIDNMAGCAVLTFDILMCSPAYERRLQARKGVS